MKIKNEKEVLQAFCSQDDFLNPTLTQPFFNEKRNEVWATDCHFMLMVDPMLLRRKYAKSEFGNKLEIRMPNINTIVTFADIESAYNSFKLMPEMVDEEGDDCECPACEGSGEVQWEYTAPDGHTYYMDSDCPVCNGTGDTKEQKKVPTGRMLPPNDALIEIDGARFMAYYMMKAIEALKLLGCRQLRHTVAYDNEANVFEVQEGIRLLIMPVVGLGLAEKVETKKED